ASVRELYRQRPNYRSNQMKNTNGWTAAILAVALCALVLVFATPGATAQSNNGSGNGVAHRLAALEATVGAQQGQIASLTSRVAVLEEKTQFMSVLGDTTLFSGTNVQVVNGMGGTETTNGLGNLIVGYNQAVGPGGDERGGSHNVVVGDQHDYLSFGGLVVGIANRIEGRFSSAIGGVFNRALGAQSSVNGGILNTASGESSLVTGGRSNVASGLASAVTGGRQNTASHQYSTVSGGRNKSTTTDFQWVGGTFRSPP
ncbi:MAG: hypothetical protein IIC73_04955, partial [Armatimonadetes bacterium]|nr:hypothetical protein [Armatimonadota bacterium]